MNHFKWFTLHSLICNLQVFSVEEKASTNKGQSINNHCDCLIMKNRMCFEEGDKGQSFVKLNNLVLIKSQS